MSPEQVTFFPAESVVIDPAQAPQIAVWVVLAAVVTVALAIVLERSRGPVDAAE
jgi:hypothetical protein